MACKLRMNRGYMGSERSRKISFTNVQNFIKKHPKKRFEASTNLQIKLNILICSKMHMPVKRVHYSHVKL